MSVKLTMANTKIVQMWADMNGITYSELANKIIAEACEHFVDGMKASLKNPDKDTEDTV